MKKILSAFISLLIIKNEILAQVLLEANGPGETYELINSVLAPGYDVTETPDCVHGEFGRHIDEIFDDTLNKNVFRFSIHTSPDNDRCKKFDRQRNEIKTYDKSPDYLKGIEGEKVEYSWLFKIASDFQPSTSFTHLHQIKAVDGTEDAMPLITLTARKANPDRLELRYAEHLSQVTLDQVNLSELKGEWIRVIEIIEFGESGSYNVELERIGDGLIIFSYSDDDIRMWKTGASFQRPKWGIYRSLNDVGSLKNEEVLFADIRIAEILPLASKNHLTKMYLGPNPLEKEIVINESIAKEFETIEVYDGAGKQVYSNQIVKGTIDISFLEKGIYIILLRGKNQPTATFKMIKN
ncbi:MAG: T9SS type A sorting domain-containing protein [Reichenbachiella sp.]